jgi:hypothetical protein
MYVLTLLLSDEINNLDDTNEEKKFLDETPCGIILEELKRKNDIQAFFKAILLDSIEYLEVNHSRIKINFLVSDLSREYENLSKKNKNKKDEGYMHVYNRLENSEEDYSTAKKLRKIHAEQENFNQKYIPPLDKESLEKIIKESTDKRIHDYCYSKLNNLEKDSDYYSDKNLMDSLYQSKNSQTLLLKYQNCFTAVTSFINSLLNSLLNNFHLLPYSVKCLCKIISILIKKKKPSINESERNVFIAKFFFGKLLFPILNDPGKEALINNFIISKNTLDNLKAIGKIINKFTSNEFYNIYNQESDYTPFNWYFLEKIGDLFNICENLIKVKLPSFIEKLINDELPSDYEYDYFKENPGEDINHRSACFNLEQIQSLLNTMIKNKDIIFADADTNKKKNGLLKTVEKLLSQNNQNLINDIFKQEIIKKPQENPKTKKKDSKEEKKVEERKVFYFLITELLTNKKYEKLFNVEQLAPHFFIEDLKSIPNEEAKIKDNIIKVKNFFCSLLYNYNKLIKTDFDEGTTGNTISILKELKKFMKSSNFVVDGTIPSEWYVNSLLEYLEKIPKDLTENDCQKLFDEIENDLTKSIKELDFEALSVILEKLKYTQKGKKYYEDAKKLLIDIQINEKTKEIIEEDFIPFDIKFDLNEDKIEDISDEQEEENLNAIKKAIGRFEITPSAFKIKDRNNFSKIKDYEKSKNCRLCLTIEDFTKKFPNLVKYQEMQDADILLIQKILNFPGLMKFYFNKIDEYMVKKGISGKESIIIKIYDYVMSKIYDKIYLQETLEKDNVIF